MTRKISLPKVTNFDWDKGNLEHVKKHGVMPSECEETFFNEPLLINKDKSHSKQEQRFQSLGKTNDGRLLFISFTIRRDKIRPISARDQNKKERTAYKGGEKDEKS